MPTDALCQIRPSDIMQLIVLDILNGRQALVHLESWAAQLKKEIKQLRDGFWIVQEPSFLISKCVV